MKNKSKEKAARAPKLYTSGDDLSKQWSVFFQCRNPETGKMERVRISEGFSQYKTVEGRKDYGNKLIDSITLKLNAGWNPFYKEGVFYKVVQDLPIYETNLLVYHLEKVLSSIELELRPKSYQSYQSHLRGFMRWSYLAGQFYCKLRELFW
jgi:hypothetical protein